MECKPILILFTKTDSSSFSEVTSSEFTEKLLSLCPFPYTKAKRICIVFCSKFCRCDAQVTVPNNHHSEAAVCRPFQYPSLPSDGKTRRNCSISHFFFSTLWWHPVKFVPELHPNDTIYSRTRIGNLLKFLVFTLIEEVAALIFFLAILMASYEITSYKN